MIGSKTRKPHIIWGFVCLVGIITLIIGIIKILDDTLTGIIVFTLGVSVISYGLSQNGTVQKNDYEETGN